MRAFVSSLSGLCVLVGLSGASGCVFDPALPAGAVVKCSSGDECPTGNVCTSAGFCVDANTADVEPPTMTNASLTPAVARAQVDVVARLRASEPLLLDPTIELQLPDGERVALAIDDEQTDRGAGDYVGVYRTTGLELQDTHLVVAELVDTSGNAASNLAVGTVAFDFVAPQPLEVQLGASHVNDEAEVTVSFAIDEDLPEFPVVEAVLDDTRIALTVIDDGERFHATYTPDGGEPEGRYRLELLATDEAGNLRPTDLGGVTLDFTAPVVAAASVPTSAFRFGDTVSVTVELDEAASVPPQVTSPLGTFSLQSSDDRFFSFRLQVVDQAPEGAFIVAVAGARDLAGNELVATNLGSVTVDASPPEITNLTTNAERFSAQPGFDTLEVTMDVTDAAGDVFADIGGAAPLTCANVMAETWRCTYVVTDADEEGLRFVQIVAADSAGNEALAAIGVIVDRTPPALVAGSVQATLEAPAASPLGDVTAVTVGSVATVSFLTTESVASVPTVAVPGTFDVSSVGPQSTSAFAFRLEALAGSHTDGPADVTASLVDEVGNAAEVTLTTLAIDATPPGAPAVDAADVIVLRRAPWGAESSGGARTLDLTGAAGAADADTTLFWWASADGAVELARAPVATDGSFGPLSLSGVDLRDTWVTSVDAAGNASATVRVRDGRWIATLADKIAGRSYPNPHSAVSRNTSVETTWVDRRGVARVGGTEQDGAALAREDGTTVSTGGGFWVRRYAGVEVAATPPVRGFHAQAYDSVRGRVVLVGGDCFDCADTWEWDGERWLERESTRKPTRLIGSVAAFDPARGVTVVFGGRIGQLDNTAPDFSNETWLWDGDDWRELVGIADAVGLSPRAFTHMTYTDLELTLLGTGEKVDGGVVVWGGTNFASIFNDMFVFLGDRWAEVDQGPTPTQGRGGAAFAYDPLLRQIVASGGATTPGTSTFDGTSWTEWPGATQPGLVYQSAAFDPIAGEIVQLGGKPNRISKLSPDLPPGSDGEVWPCLDDNPERWRWTGSDWVERDVSWVAWQGAGPDGCAQLQLVFDAAREEMLAIGWVTDNESPPEDPDELTRLWTYLLDGDDANVASPLKSPPGRQGAELVVQWFFGTHTLLFGGVDKTGELGVPFADTWYRRGTEWIDMGTWSVSRTHFAAAAPVHLGEVVFVGGHAAGSDSDAVGRYALLNGLSLDPVTPQPPPRISGAMARLGDTDKAVLFGGADSGTGDRLADTWEYDGVAWTLMTPSASPPARSSHAMAWDENLGAVVLFGGEGDAGLLDDTWVYDAGEWSPLSPMTSPEPRADHTLTEHSGRSTLLLIGGDSDVVIEDLAWSFDGGEWSPAFVDGLPANLFDHSATYNPDADRMTLFGGDSAVGGLDTTWDVFDSGRPGQAFTFELTASGVDEDWREGATFRVVAGGAGGEAVPVPGASLGLWYRGAFAEVAQHAALPSAPAALVFATDATLAVDRVDLFDRVMFRVTPLGENDTNLALLETDYVELELEYRLP